MINPSLFFLKKFTLSLIQKQNIFFLIVIQTFFYLIPTNTLKSCPVVIFGSDLRGLAKEKILERNFHFLVPSTKGWQEMPLQIEFMNNRRRLLFLSQENKKMEGLDAFDRIVFRAEDLRKNILKKSIHEACKIQKAYKVLDFFNRDRHGYLVACKRNKEFIPYQYALNNVVQFRKKQGSLVSPIYQYGFNKNNYLLFREIFVGSPYPTLVGSDSDIMIKANFKYFFNMYFNKDDIISKISAYNIGKLGVNAKLSFLLRLLFFNIKLSLSTDVHFYEDSAFIPMIMNLPLDPRKSVKAHSGILYYGFLAKQNNKLANLIRMPTSSRDNMHKIKIKDELYFMQIKRQFCKQKRCVFSYQYQVGEHVIKIYMLLRPFLVERGFFPIFIDNLNEWQGTHDWSIPSSGKSVRRNGFYFESSFFT